MGQPIPVPLEVPELGLADLSALPAQPPAPDPLRDGPDDRVGGAGHHEPPHAVRPPHTLARVPAPRVPGEHRRMPDRMAEVQAARAFPGRDPGGLRTGVHPPPDPDGAVAEERDPPGRGGPDAPKVRRRQGGQPVRRARGAARRLPSALGRRPPFQPRG